MVDCGQRKGHKSGQYKSLRLVRIGAIISPDLHVLYRVSGWDQCTKLKSPMTLLTSALRLSQSSSFASEPLALTKGTSHGVAGWRENNWSVGPPHEAVRCRCQPGHYANAFLASPLSTSSNTECSVHAMTQATTRLLVANVSNVLDVKDRSAKDIQQSSISLDITTLPSPALVYINLYGTIPGRLTSLIDSPLLQSLQVP